MYRLFIGLLVVILIGVSLPARAQEGETATVNTILNLRAGPGIGYPVLDTLSPETQVILEGRNSSGYWALVHTVDNSLRGWVAARYLILPDGFSFNALPVLDELIGNNSVEADAAVEAAEGQAVALTRTRLNVRSGPGVWNSRLTTFPTNTRVVIEGRNRGGDWVLVQSDDGTRGWVAVAFLVLNRGVSIASLPVTQENTAGTTAANTTDTDAGTDDTTFTAVTVPPPTGTVPGSAYDAIENMVSRLENTPVLYNFSTGRQAQIFRTGQARGNNPRVYTKAGDSITANLPFMVGFGNGSYNLGQYGHLQATINYFSVPPRDGVPNSFLNPSLAAVTGYHSSLLLDPIWSDPDFCRANESSLVCEFRLTRPSVIVIMLGSIDVQTYSLEEYTGSMQQMIQTSISYGVIPVLTSFPVSNDYLYWEKSLRFNMILLDLAEQYRIPVINLWRAAQPLPAHGLGADKIHLSTGGNPYSFNGEQHQYGTAIRNLITLQALDELRVNILSG